MKTARIVVLVAVALALTACVTADGKRQGIFINPSNNSKATVFGYRLGVPL